MKKGFYIGFLGGGFLGVVVALSMDFMLGGALGSGWRDAVAHDLGALLGRTFERNSPAVISGVIAVIGFIGVFGAVIGGVFGAVVARLFSFLTKEQ